MLEYLKERLFPLLIAFSALSVSASAAFYSVSGLSKLFAGAAFAVIVMTASLEIAKLVIASLLYQYRKTLPKFLKYYLSIACFVLILITSMGIYGFLSAAYQETAAKSGNIDAQITLIEVKRDNIREQLVVYNEEKSSINTAVASLRNGLSNNKIQYTDTSGNIVTTTSSSTRRALEKQLDQAIERQTTINSKVDILNEKLFNYETEIVKVSTNNEIAGELGPLKYLSGLTGIPMDEIINYLLLTIIFVFDPLAIALVIAANFAFAQLKPKTKENLYGEDIEVKEELKPEFEIEEEELIEDLTYGQEDLGEKRMNIIGQNGNDGLHYPHEIYGNDPGDEHTFNTPPKKEALPEGYVKPSAIEVEMSDEKEIQSIIGKPLTGEQMEKLRDLKFRTTSNSDDDLKITY
tara:strand:+ start:1440 stop:2657 length:1218 start_codon:yes stop_codon:yes gene_type:complete